MATEPQRPKSAKSNASGDDADKSLSSQKGNFGIVKSKIVNKVKVIGTKGKKVAQPLVNQAADTRHLLKFQQQRVSSLALNKSTVKSGFLDKMGDILKTWHQRYFVLDNKGVLFYYTPASMKLRGILYLHDVTEQAMIEDNPKYISNDYYSFKLATRNGRIWRFRTADESLRTQWINILNQELTKAKSKQSIATTTGNNSKNNNNNNNNHIRNNNSNGDLNDPLVNARSLNKLTSLSPTMQQMGHLSDGSSDADKKNTHLMTVIILQAKPEQPNTNFKKYFHRGSLYGLIRFVSNVDGNSNVRMYRTHDERNWRNPVWNSTFKESCFLSFDETSIDYIDIIVRKRANSGTDRFVASASRIQLLELLRKSDENKISLTKECLFYEWLPIFRRKQVTRRTNIDTINEDTALQSAIDMNNMNNNGNNIGNGKILDVNSHNHISKNDDIAMPTPRSELEKVGKIQIGIGISPIDSLRERNRAMAYQSVEYTHISDVIIERFRFDPNSVVCKTPHYQRLIARLQKRPQTGGTIQMTNVASGSGNGNGNNNNNSSSNLQNASHSSLYNALSATSLSPMDPTATSEFDSSIGTNINDNDNNHNNNNSNNNNNNNNNKDMEEGKEEKNLVLSPLLPVPLTQPELVKSLSLHNEQDRLGVHFSKDSKDKEGVVVLMTDELLSDSDSNSMNGSSENEIDIDALTPSGSGNNNNENNSNENVMQQNNKNENDGTMLHETNMDNSNNTSNSNSNSNEESPKRRWRKKTRVPKSPAPPVPDMMADIPLYVQLDWGNYSFRTNILKFDSKFNKFIWNAANYLFINDNRHKSYQMEIKLIDARYAHSQLAIGYISWKQMKEIANMQNENNEEKDDSNDNNNNSNNNGERLNKRKYKNVKIALYLPSPIKDRDLAQIREFKDNINETNQSSDNMEATNMQEKEDKEKEKENGKHNEKEKTKNKDKDKNKNDNGHSGSSSSSTSDLNDLNELNEDSVENRDRKISRNSSVQSSVNHGSPTKHGRVLASYEIDDNYFEKSNLENKNEDEMLSDDDQYLGSGDDSESQSDNENSGNSGNSGRSGNSDENDDNNNNNNNNNDSRKYITEEMIPDSITSEVSDTSGAAATVTGDDNNGKKRRKTTNKLSMKERRQIRREHKAQQKKVKLAQKIERKHEKEQQKLGKKKIQNARKQHSFDPSTEERIGELMLKIRLFEKKEFEKDFIDWIINEFDKNNDGVLSKDEISSMFYAFDLPFDESNSAFKDWFNEIDKNNSNTISKDEFSKLLLTKSFQQSVFMSKIFFAYLKDISLEDAMYRINNNNDSGNLMTGISRMTQSPFYSQQDKTTELLLNNQANSLPSHGIGTRIHVRDRESGLLVQEHIPGYVRVAMKIMFNSKFSRMITSKKKFHNNLLKLSKKQGKKYDDSKSIAEIEPFIKMHKVDRKTLTKSTISDYGNFNNFFAREMMKDLRPIASVDDETIIVSPADCRLLIFNSIQEATKLWIKGKQFTIDNVFGGGEWSDKFYGGSMLIARLAPQDYHRWHYPVFGKIIDIKHIDGALYTVNPIAINQAVDVYTENKRCLVIMESPLYGYVAVVVIAAVMVGSYSLYNKIGENVRKGTEMGEFRFGGSTILVFFMKSANVIFDDDLNENSLQPIETLVRVNTRIARFNNSK